jgi:hypothetical protein
VSSAKTYVILLLAATTVGGALLAWRQYRELVDLRAAAMNRDERADLQKRVWDLEKQNRDLQSRVAARGETVDGEKPAEGERPGRGGRGGDRGAEIRGRGPEMQQAVAIRELMNKPEVQAMLNLQQKAAIDGRYAALFKNLNLSSEQVEKLKTLLAERTNTVQDVMSAARDQGINPRENPEGMRKLIADAQNEINSAIKGVIGEQGFAQLSTYEQTLPQRNLVNDLQQRLSYTNTPLTSTQAEQLVQILAANQPPRQPNAAGVANVDVAIPAPGGRGGPPPGGRGPDLGGMISGILGPAAGSFIGAMEGGRTAPVTSAAVAQAQTVLAPPQVAALQQIQQQQQSQQQLRQLVNETLGANQAQSTGTPPTKSGNAPSPRPRG